MFLLATTPQPSFWRDDFLTWLTAISTAVGVLAAIVAGVYAARAFGREQDRDRRREEDERRAQATLVSAWTSYRMSLDGQKPVAVIHYRNASSQPVYEASVRPNCSEPPSGT